MRHQHELGQHPDRHADQVEGPEPDAVVLDDVAGPGPPRRHVAPDEVRDPGREDPGEQRRDRHLVGRVGPGRGDDRARHELPEDEGDDPRGDGDRHVDRPGRRRGTPCVAIVACPPARPATVTPGGTRTHCARATRSLSGEEGAADGAATVGEAPTEGHRQPCRVAGAQVVAVRLTLRGQVVDPHLGPSVLVRQRDDGGLRAGRSGALATGLRHGSRTYSAAVGRGVDGRPPRCSTAA